MSMDDTLGLSVIIPTHTGRISVKRPVASLLAADYPRLEIIVVCDGPSAATELVLAEIRDPRLTLLEIEKQGASAARNHGLKAARFDWVAFVDDDDVPRANWVKSWLMAAGADADFITGTAVRHVDGHAPDVRPCKLEPSNPTMDASRLLAGAFWSRKSLLIGINGYDCALRFSENHDLGLRLCEHFEGLTPQPRISHATEPVIDLYVQASASRNSRYGTAHAESARLLLDRFPDRLAADPQHKASLFRIISRGERLQEQHRAAIRTAFLAVQCEPSNLANHRALLLALWVWPTSVWQRRSRATLKWRRSTRQ